MRVPAQRKFSVLAWCTGTAINAVWAVAGIAGFVWLHRALHHNTVFAWIIALPIMALGWFAFSWLEDDVLPKIDPDNELWHRLTAFRRSANG